MVNSERHAYVSTLGIMKALNSFLFVTPILIVVIYLLMGSPVAYGYELEGPRKITTGEKSVDYEVGLDLIAMLAYVSDHSINGTTAEQYSQNHKALAYFGGGIDLGLGGVGFNLYVDLADYVSGISSTEFITQEGEDDWVTVWIDMDVSALSAGLLPVGAGIVYVDFDSLDQDPKRHWDLGILNADIPFIQLQGLSGDPDGLDPPSATQNLILEVDASVANLSFNLLRFEIQRSALSQMVRNFMPGYLIDGELDAEEIEAISDTFLDMVTEYNEDGAIGLAQSVLGSTRMFTRYDDGMNDASDGVFASLIGGWDVTADGVLDHHYPVIFELIGIPILGSDLWFEFENLGDHTANFDVVCVEHPEFWSVKAMDDNDPLFNEYTYDADAVGPGQTKRGLYKIAATSYGAESGVLKFELRNEQDVVFDEISFEAQKIDPNNNAAPSLEILSAPSGQIVPGQIVDIEYSAFDPDDTAQVTFAYDPDLGVESPWLEGDNHIVIGSQEEADGSGVFHWDTSGVESGDYVIWGVIHDGQNLMRLALAPGSITVSDPPEIFDVTVGGDAVTLGANLQRAANQNNEISAWAADPDEVVLLEIYVDGVQEAVEGPFQSYEPINANYLWNTVNESLGGHDVEIRATDSWGAVSTFDFTVNLLEPVSLEYLSAGSVSPAQGTTSDDFTFSVTYTSDHGIAPQAVTLYVDGSSYPMAAQGSSWTSGVEFVSVRNFSAGNYPFHFTADLPSGESLRFPADITNDPNLVVGESSEGWEIKVTGLSVSESYVSPGGSVEGTGSVNGTVPSTGFVYENVPYEFILYSNQGVEVDSSEGVLPTITQGQTVEVDSGPLSVPSNATGVYQLVFSIYPTKDTNFQNNVYSRSIFIGEESDTNVWLFSTTHSEVLLTPTDPTHTFNNSEYAMVQFDGAGIRVVRGGESKWIDNGDYELFDSGSVALKVESIQNIGDPFALVSFGLKATASQVAFVSGEASTYPGQETTFTINGLSSLYRFRSSVNFLDKLDVDEASDWYSGTALENNYQRASYEFTPSSGASAGSYDFAMEGEMRDSYLKFLSVLSLNVLAPPPHISSLSSGVFSADDALEITGSNLGSPGQVKFGNVVATEILSWSSTLIRCVVPEGVVSGNLFVDNAAGTSNPLSYTALSSTGDPEVVQPIPDQPFTVTSNWSLVANLNNVFWDPNGDDLEFGATVDPTLLAVHPDSLAIGKLYLRYSGAKSVMTAVTVSATDADLVTVNDEFNLDLSIGTPPPAPASLDVDPALAAVGGTVTFSWPQVEGATQYAVHKEGAEVGTTAVNQFQIPQAEMTDTGSYHVTACNVYGCSDPSPSADLVVTPTGTFYAMEPSSLSFERAAGEVYETTLVFHNYSGSQIDVWAALPQADWWSVGCEQGCTVPANGSIQIYFAASSQMGGCFPQVGTVNSENIIFHSEIEALYQLPVEETITLNIPPCDLRAEIDNGNLAPGDTLSCETPTLVSLVSDSCSGTYDCGHSSNFLYSLDDMETWTEFYNGWELFAEWNPPQVHADRCYFRIFGTDWFGVEFDSQIGPFVLDCRPPYENLTSYFVSETGNDSNPGTRDLPLATISAAILAADSGDSVVLYNGNFHGPGNNNLSWVNKDLLFRSDSGQRDSCIVDLGGSAGFDFTLYELNQIPVVQFESMTFQDGSPAIHMFGMGPGSGFPPVSLKITDCKISGGGSGVSMFHGNGQISSTEIVGATGVGYESYNGFNSFNNCSIRNNGTGLKVESYSMESISAINMDVVGNGTGIDSWLEYGSFTLSSCRVDSNMGTGIIFRSYESGVLDLQETRVMNNHGDGVRIIAYTTLKSSNSFIDSNLGNGIGWETINTLGRGCLLVNTSLSHNQGWGFGMVDRGVSKAMEKEGVENRGPVQLSTCHVDSNQTGGFGIGGDSAQPIILYGSTFVRNNGPSAYLYNSGTYTITSCTFARNAGTGLIVDNGSLYLRESIVAENAGPAAVVSPEATLAAVDCTNISNNGGGDWLAPLDGFLGSPGNQDVPPQFCDSEAGDFHLSASSLCAEENNPGCGRIGALGVGCEARTLACRELQDYDPTTGAITSPLVDNGPVTVKGVVFVSPGTYSTTSGGYLQDDTGGMNFWSSPPEVSIREGDLVLMTGPFWSYSGELYVGNYYYAVLDSNQAVFPHELSVSELLSDFDNVGSFVRISGTISSIGPSSLWLSDGVNQVEVLLTDYVGVNSDGLSVGMTGWVQGPCTILYGVMNVKPRRASDMSFVGGNWTDITLGDLADPEPATGVAWSDYDGDGDEDLLVVRTDNTPRLFRNNGAGVFTDGTPTCIGSVRGPGASWGDFNHDAQPDIFLSDFGDTARVLENTGGGSFACVALGDVGSAPATPYPGTWVDYNLDGKLDLVMANYDDTGVGRGLEIFDGARGFAEDTPPSLQFTGEFQSMQWVDLDLDRDLDLILGMEQGRVIGYENKEGVFVEHLIGERDACQGLDVGDFNNDGLPDLFVTHWGNGDELIRNNGNWDFQVLDSAGIQTGGFGQSCVWGDYDNDGWLDLLVVRNNVEDILYHNNGDQTFAVVPEPLLGVTRQSNGAANADIDGDGDLDIYVANEAGQGALLRNDWAPEANNWVKFRLSGVSGQVNSPALGARVVLFAGSQMQTRQIVAGNGLNSQNSSVVHFGLGQASSVDSVRIYWPTKVQEIQLQVEQFLAVNSTHEFALDSVVPTQEIPRSGCALYAAVPNPFNPRTTIRYYLSEPTPVRLRIFDVSGRLVKTLVSGETMGAGMQETVWMGQNEMDRVVAAGVYFYRLEAGGFTDTKRMTLLK